MATKTAKVPFCKPHSSEIHFLCSNPEAKYLTSGVPQRKCISLECGLQNGTLAVFVATQLFDQVIFMVPTAAYALIMFVTSIIFVLIVRKIN